MNKVTILVGIITGVLGFCGGLATNLVTYVSKGEELQVRLVELAISILREEPKQPLLPLREWAIGVIDKNSDVPLTEDAKKALMRFPLAAQGRANGEASVGAAGGSTSK